MKYFIAACFMFIKRLVCVIFLKIFLDNFIIFKFFTYINKLNNLFGKIFVTYFYFIRITFSFIFIQLNNILKYKKLF